MRATSTDAFLLLVDKPPGVTSHDVVAIVRRALGTPRVGHGGTLDPFATGLLVLLGGGGTRLMPYLHGEPKEYDAAVRFGFETDTDDATGEPRETAPPPSRERIGAAIRSLTGALDQIPPAFSAKHVEGRRAYAFARRGTPRRLAASRVHVHRWDLLDFDGETLRSRISCGAGTYVRALARDLGRLTGSAAHLSALRRIHAGDFDVADADTLDAIRAGSARPRPIREALGGMAEQRLDDDEMRRVTHGMGVTAAVPGDRAALVGRDGTLLAVASRQGDLWHPDVVVAHV